MRIGRFKSLEMHYTKVHLKPIKQLWDDFDLRQRASKHPNDNKMPGNNEPPTILFSSWLPSFYDELLLYLEQEWKWYRAHCIMLHFLKIQVLVVCFCHLSLNSVSYKCCLFPAIIYQGCNILNLLKLLLAGVRSLFLMITKPWFQSCSAKPWLL